MLLSSKVLGYAFSSRKLGRTFSGCLMPACSRIHASILSCHMRSSAEWPVLEMFLRNGGRFVCHDAHWALHPVPRLVATNPRGSTPQRLPQANVVEQDVFHAALHRAGIQRLGTHGGVGVERAHDRVEQLGFQVG